MRLRISPRKALNEIDKAIEAGYRQLSELTIPRDIISDEWRSEIKKWFSETAKMLGEIFINFTPVYQFLKDTMPQESMPSFVEVFSEQKKLELPDHIKEIRSCLETLTMYYNEISKSLKIQIEYNPEKGELWFFDICCNFKPYSNEGNLCDVLINEAGIGKIVSLNDIFQAMNANTGSREYNPNNEKDVAVIKNAVDGINKKAKDNFKFNLINHQKNGVKINIPLRLVYDIEFQRA